MSHRRLSTYMDYTRDETFPYHENAKRKHASVSSTPRGVLAVHVKRGHVYTIEPVTYLFQRSAKNMKEINIYVTLESGQQIKYSHVCQRVIPPKTVIIDDIKHFLLWVTNNRKDPENYIKIKLVGFTTAHMHKVLAQKDIHLYEIVKKLYLVETLQFHDRQDTLIAELEVEFCFAYGGYGYGYSNQLENRHRTPQEQISHSLFFRPEPPPDRLHDDSTIDVMACTPVGHPSFINFTRKVNIGETAREFKSQLQSGLLDLSSEEPTLLIGAIRKRMHSMQTAFSRVTNRRDRLSFLRNLIFGHKTESKDFSTKGRKLKHRTQQLDADAIGHEAQELETYEEEELEEVGAKEGDGGTLGQDVVDLAPLLTAAPGIVSRGTQRLNMPEETRLTVLDSQQEQEAKVAFPSTKTEVDPEREQPKSQFALPLFQPQAPSASIDKNPDKNLEEDDDTMAPEEERLEMSRRVTWRQRRQSIIPTFRNLIKPGAPVATPRLVVIPPTPTGSDEEVEPSD